MSIRVLVVEDEMDLADFVVRGLREEGFVVEHIADGQRGLQAMQIGGWDLILLDWWLPGEDGLSVLRRFRASAQEAPVLFLTARDSVVDRVRGLDSGADDYLCKPFAFDELLARMRALLRRRDRVLEQTITHADVTIDLATHRAASGRPAARPDRQRTRSSYVLRSESPSVAFADAYLRPRLGRELRRPLKHSGSACDGAQAQAGSPWSAPDS